MYAFCNTIFVVSIFVRFRSSDLFSTKYICFRFFSFTLYPAHSKVGRVITTAEFSRHCVLSGVNHHRGWPCYQSDEIKTSLIPPRENRTQNRSVYRSVNWPPQPNIQQNIKRYICNTNITNNNFLQRYYKKYYWNKEYFRTNYVHHCIQYCFSKFAV